jgi:hypothetical protein
MSEPTPAQHTEAWHKAYDAAMAEAWSRVQAASFVSDAEYLSRLRDEAALTALNGFYSMHPQEGECLEDDHMAERSWQIADEFIKWRISRRIHGAMG